MLSGSSSMTLMIHMIERLVRKLSKGIIRTNGKIQEFLAIWTRRKKWWLSYNEKVWQWKIPTYVFIKIGFLRVFHQSRIAWTIHKRTFSKRYRKKKQWRRKLWMIGEAQGTQCGNWRIFYHSDFTWNWFRGFLKYKICHFNTFTGSEFWFPWIFALFEGWNLPNRQNPKPLKWHKWQILHF